ncbi:hypothetical protein [Streptomyces sp. NPDC017993]|uniref:hypothetical protein n=1 Tax=Streptomyces sp. NPDC017993 TaxID=3365027 RepID=UPI0037B85EDF
MAHTELASPARAEHPRATDQTAAKAPVVQHVTPAGRDVRYDAGTGDSSLPVLVHFRDGSTAHADLVLNPSQVLVFGMQVERAVNLREKARGAV